MIISNPHGKRLPQIEQHLIDMFPRVEFGHIFGPPGSKVKVYVPIKNDKVIFNVYPVPTIAHEIAHMVEMTNINRCLKVDWGMKPDWFDYTNHLAYILREARVRAIEAHLHGEDINSRLYSRVRTYLFDFNIIKKQTNRFPSFPIFQDYLDDVQRKTYARWSKDRIEAEWIKRVEFVRHHFNLH